MKPFRHGPVERGLSGPEVLRLCGLMKWLVLEQYFTSRFDYISCELLALRGGEHGRFHRANTVEEFS